MEEFSCYTARYLALRARRPPSSWAAADWERENSWSIPLPRWTLTSPLAATGSTPRASMATRPAMWKRPLANGCARAAAAIKSSSPPRARIRRFRICTRAGWIAPASGVTWPPAWKRWAWKMWMCIIYTGTMNRARWAKFWKRSTDLWKKGA